MKYCVVTGRHIHQNATNWCIFTAFLEIRLIKIISYWHSKCLLAPVKILSSTYTKQISSSFINRHGSNAECEKPPTSSPAQSLSEKCIGSCLEPYRLSLISFVSDLCQNISRGLKKSCELWLHAQGVVRVYPPSRCSTKAKRIQLRNHWWIILKSSFSGDLIWHITFTKLETTLMSLGLFPSTGLED